MSKLFSMSGYVPIEKYVLVLTDTTHNETRRVALEKIVSYKVSNVIWNSHEKYWMQNTSAVAYYKIALRNL